MKRIYITAILILTFTLCWIQDINSANPYSDSIKRRNEIYSIIMRYVKAKEDLSDEDVQAAIYQDVGKSIELQPTQKADLRDKKVFVEIVRKEVSKMFPQTAKEVREASEKLAEVKFKLYKQLDYVTVHYSKGKGERSYKVEGIFNGYGGNSIKIGETIIPIFDLLPDTRAKFDPNYSKKRKAEFVEERVSRYYREKNLLSNESYLKLKNDQIKNNQALDYIFFDGEWMTANKVTEILINTYAEKQQKAWALAKAKQKDPITGETGETGIDIPAVDTTKAEYDKLIKFVNERKQEINLTCAGIDADQGYRNALWGMTHKQVNILYSDQLAPDSIAEVEILNYEGQAVNKVELYFLYDTLYKVVIHFDISIPEAIVTYVKSFYDRYGRTDEEKEEAKKATEEVPAEPEPAPAEGEAPPEQLLPAEEVHHWSGTITKGTVILRSTDDRKAWKEFIFIKENPTLQKELALKAAKEIQRKKEAAEEAKRQKELEKLKNKIEF